MMPTLKVAVIGCGRMGTFTRPELRERIGSRWLPLNHAEAAASVDGLELAALCDVNAEALQRACADFGVSQSYQDYQALLDELSPDIVSIATRTAERPQILIDAAKAGVRGIHAEKPLSTNLKEAERVGQTLGENNVQFTYGTLRRYMPIYDAAADAVAAGDIGDLQNVTIRMGRGPLLWMHPHSIDLICRFAGTNKVSKVYAVLDMPDDAMKGQVIDADPLIVSAQLVFENGVTGTIVAAEGRDVELMGTKGQIVIYQNGAAWWKQEPASGDIVHCPVLEQEPKDPISPLVVAFQELRDAIAGSGDTRLTIAEVVNQQRLLFAIVESHLRGGVGVDPKDVDPCLTVTGLTDGRYA